ncbi:GNAT family N-acetyltransferase [Dongia sp.]|uniref:GNAT family N-acetyltransferase n=1 Tax=Dongia sp. TaxID=1977262 RepID=UPI0035B3B2A6
MTGDLPFVMRPAVPDDAPAIAAIVSAAYAKWVPVIGRKPLPMQVDYAKAVLEHDFDVVSGDGRLVGLIETMPRADHLWIENLAVHPEAQGQGIGRLLLARAEEKAKELGTFDLRLLTNGAFTANIALYLKYGYALDKQEEFMNGTTVYMSKKLTR